MQCESVEDEFELFRAQSYGVESVLRHQRAASVRASVKVKVTTLTEDDLEKQSSEVIPQPRPAAERKASFKSSARRRIYQQRIQEEEIVADDHGTTASGPCDQHGDDGRATGRPLPGTTLEGRPVAVDDVELDRRRAENTEFDGDVDLTSRSRDFYRVYRMRSFYTKSGNIVNRGDSMRLRTPTSGGGVRHNRDAVDALSATGSSICVVADRSCAKQCDTQSVGDIVPDTTAPRDTSRDHLTVSRISTSGPARRQRMNSANESTEDAAATAYKVLVLGSQGVGKTKLTEQLMTSEYLANKDSFAGTNRICFYADT